MDTESATPGIGISARVTRRPVSRRGDSVQDMPARARLYIVATWLAGGGLLAWQLSSLTMPEPWLLLAVVVLTAAAQSLQVVGATDHSSYNIGLVGYAFAFVHWGPSAAMLVIVVACIAEWAWQRLPWYIQTFNLAALAVAVTGAGLLYARIASGETHTSLLRLAALLVAGAAFIVANHLLVGLVIYLARGETFAESGVFRRLTLIMDATLLGMGALAAIVFPHSPAAALLALMPLYLIYNTLRIPSLERQAITDPKTGLYNARYFNEVLEREIERADRHERPLTVVVGDLDLLRNINNTYGHLAGDSVLIGVARILTASVRDYDVVARIGGEEFAILMGETSLDEAMAHVESIRESIESADFTIATSLKPIRVTMSFGVAERETTGQQASEILHNADLALYKAKLTGRNRTCLSSDVLEATGIRTMRAPHHLIPSDGAVEAAVPVEPPEMSEAPAQERRQAPARTVEAFVAAVAVVAMVSAFVMVRPPLRADWLGLLAFALVTLLAESLSIDLYARDAAVSTAVAPFLAGTLLFGPAAGVALSLITAGAALIKHRSPLDRFFLNAGVHTLAGLTCIALVRSMGTPFGDMAWPLQFAVTIAATATVFLLTTWPVALVIRLTSGQPLAEAWVERFAWLWPYYGALGVITYAFVYAYRASGLLGVAVMLVPLMAVRLSQSQYLERTRSVVSELRESNAQLERRTKEVSLLSEELLVVLSNIVDLRDPYVLGHSQHVARYARLIAEEMGLSPDRVQIIHDAGMLHDVGKLGIPDLVLAKPGHLTEEEYHLVKRHCALGAQIIGHSRSLSRLVPCVRHHHERYDGLGYPDGLSGRAIPLEARVLAVADAVEAMASDRPYRSGMAPEEILAELEAGSGTQFDPEAGAAFAAVVAREGTGMIVNSAHVVRLETDRRLQGIRREIEVIAVEASDLGAG